MSGGNYSVHFVTQSSLNLILSLKLDSLALVTRHTLFLIKPLPKIER